MARKPKPGPGQLKLLMSASEIMATHEPNNPDRLYHGTDISVSRASGVREQRGRDPREGQPTHRPERTDEVVNEVRLDPSGRLADPPFSRSFRSLRGPWAKPETNDQLYARKLTEAQKPTGRGSLAGRIAKEGVQTPIALGHEAGTGRPDFVAGGHHRLAVMQHLNPDQLLPVLHVRSVGEAQSSGL